MAEKTEKSMKRPEIKKKKLTGDAKNIVEGKLLDASDEPKPKKPLGPRKPSKADPVSKSFSNFEENVAAPLNKIQSRPQVTRTTATGLPQLRQPWTGPDKEMYRGQFFAPEPLPQGRNPAALGLPPIPRGSNALPLGNPESVFGGTPPSRPVPSPAPMSLPESRISGIPQPRVSAGQPPPTVPNNPDILAKFRGMAPAAAGAATWDPAFNPESDVPSWVKDDEAARFEERRATNAEKGDWYASQTPEQIKQNLNLAATAQGDPAMRNIDAVQMWRNLQGRK